MCQDAQVEARSPDKHQPELLVSPSLLAVTPLLIYRLHTHFDRDANGAVVNQTRVFATSDDGNLYAIDGKPFVGSAEESLYAIGA